jgi:hypothetical protein
VSECLAGGGCLTAVPVEAIAASGAVTTIHVWERRDGVRRRMEQVSWGLETCCGWAQGLVHDTVAAMCCTVCVSGCVCASPAS